MNFHTIRSTNNRWDSTDRLKAIDTSTRLEIIRASTNKYRRQNATDITTKTQPNDKEFHDRQSKDNLNAKNEHQFSKKTSEPNQGWLQTDTKEQCDENEGMFSYKEQCDSDITKIMHNDMNEINVKDKENEFHLNLAFVDEKITDLDDLSNPQSPQRVTGSPRHEFCYSETDLTTAVENDTDDPPDGVDVILRKSRSHESFQDPKHVASAAKHNYINLGCGDVSDALPSSPPSLDDHADEFELNTTEVPTSVPQDNSLKRSFVSLYSIQLGQSDIEDRVSHGSNDSWNKIPRRQSYKSAISINNDDTSENNVILPQYETSEKEKIYDVPRISVVGSLDVEGSLDVVGSLDVESIEIKPGEDNPRVANDQDHAGLNLEVDVSLKLGTKEWDTSDVNVASSQSVIETNSLAGGGIDVIVGDTPFRRKDEPETFSEKTETNADAENFIAYF